MAAGTVVVYFNVFEHGLTHLFTRGEIFPMNSFHLQAVKETLSTASSSVAGSHRYALTEPYVNLSIHTALVIQGRFVVLEKGCFYFAVCVKPASVWRQSGQSTGHHSQTRHVQSLKSVPAHKKSNSSLSFLRIMRMLCPAPHNSALILSPKTPKR